MSEQWERSGAQFDKTPWSIIKALRADDEAERKRAQSVMIERYWPAAYAWARRSGMDREAASEFTQSFFAEVVLARQLFERADKDKSRLRSLVLASLKRYAIDRHRRKAARHEQPLTALNGTLEHLRVEPDDASASPDEAFERGWSITILQEAIRRAERHFLSTGRDAHWSLFESRVLRPAISQVGAGDLSNIATEHGFRSPADAAAAVQTVKRRVLSLMKEIVAESASDSAELEEEFRMLVASAGPRPTKS